jgi:hypothetical protein
MGGVRIPNPPVPPACSENGEVASGSVDRRILVVTRRRHRVRLEAAIGFARLTSVPSVVSRLEPVGSGITSARLAVAFGGRCIWAVVRTVCEFLPVVLMGRTGFMRMSPRRPWRNDHSRREQPTDDQSPGRSETGGVAVLDRSVFSTT